MKRVERLTHYRFYLWLMATALVFGALFSGMGIVSPAHGNANATATRARFATPLSSPTNNGGAAQWSVKQMSVVSNYPNGFDFVLDASSSAGKITKATVFWRHSTIHPSAMLGSPDTTGKLVAHWTPIKSRNIPGWVGIDFWWQLVDDQGNNFETAHGYTEYADKTRQWKRLVSDDAVIHWDASLPDNVGSQVATALKQERDAYLTGWGKLLDYKPQIIVYANYDAWKEWNPTVNAANIEGQTDPAWGSTVQVYDAANPNAMQSLAYGVVLHEVEHLYQLTFGANGTYLMQTWFYEGDATYFEAYQGYDFLGVAKLIASKGELPDLQSGLAQRGSNRTTYDVGYAFWKYLEVAYGPDTHRKVWEQIGKGLPIGLALQTATGKKFADLELDFRAWLGAPVSSKP